jgi:RNA polymerase sigma factor (sigma-70 family)
VLGLCATLGDGATPPPDSPRDVGRVCSTDTTGYGVAVASGQDQLLDAVLAREQARRLQKQLRKLPEDQRTIVLLAYYGELTHSEIAHVLELPLSVVDGAMTMALESLRANAEQLAA